MTAALDWLGTEKDIKLVVVSYNKGALGFYEKMGFQRSTAEVPLASTQLPTGKCIRRIEMIKFAPK